MTGSMDLIKKNNIPVVNFDNRNEMNEISNSLRFFGIECIDMFKIGW